MLFFGFYGPKYINIIWLSYLLALSVWTYLWKVIKNKRVVGTNFDIYYCLLHDQL